MDLDAVGCNVLFVGAGAVGTVYAHYARTAGANVAFFVKSKYQSELQSGFTLHEWKLFQKKPRSWEFKDYPIYSTADEAGKTPWDVVVLTFASTAIDNAWLQDFFSKVKTKRVLSLQPSLKDKERLLKANAFPPENLTMGSIPIISYHSPLPKEKLPSGYAFILPPGSKMTLDGGGFEKIQSIFEPGGLPCAKGSHKEGFGMASLLIALVRTLEHFDWSFKKFLQGDGAQQVSRGARELIRISAALLEKSEKQPLGVKMLSSPAGVKMFIRSAPLLFPFDIETYLQVHFTKVREQQIQSLHDFVAEAKKRALPHEAMEGLAK